MESQTKELRIKDIRSAVGLSQEAFGTRIGVSGASVSYIENGERNLTDRMARDVCREFNVNPDWLEHGDGEMFLRPSEELYAMAGDIVSGDDEYAKAFLKAIATLSKEERALLYKVMERVVKEFPI